MWVEPLEKENLVFFKSIEVKDFWWVAEFMNMSVLNSTVYYHYGVNVK
jgi:hypothetical protein